MMQSEARHYRPCSCCASERRLASSARRTAGARAGDAPIIGEACSACRKKNKEAVRVLEEALAPRRHVATMTARLHLALSQAREMTGDIDVARAELASTFAA